MTKLDHKELKRIYYYPCGYKHEFQNVVSIAISDSGNHRLECEDGSKHIVAPGWLVISLDVKEWTF